MAHDHRHTHVQCFRYFVHNDFFEARAKSEHSEPAEVSSASVDADVPSADTHISTADTQTDHADTDTNVGAARADCEAGQGAGAVEQAAVTGSEVAVADNANTCAEAM